MTIGYDETVYLYEIQHNKHDMPTRYVSYTKPRNPRVVSSEGVTFGLTIEEFAAETVRTVQ